MQHPKKNVIALDLIGLSESYEGGATVFARSILSEIVNNPICNFVVILDERSKHTNEHISNNSSLITFHYFKSRDNLLVKVLYKIATQILPKSNLLSRIQRYRWHQPIKFIEDNALVCLTPSTYINFPLKGVKHYCTLHDVQEKALPQFFTRTQKVFRNAQVLNTLRNVSGLQVSSKFIRNEIARFYPNESQKINFVIIPEGFSSSEIEIDAKFRRQRELPFRIIFPANYWPHKNHIVLLKALSRLNYTHKIELICTGYLFGKELEVLTLLKQMNLKNVSFLGFVSRDELMDLYSKSHIVISCSVYESSSLPILEGAALGCIPVASDIPSHIEMSEKFRINLFESENVNDLEKILTNTFESISKNDYSIQEFNAKALINLSWSEIIKKYYEILLLELKCNKLN